MRMVKGIKRAGWEGGSGDNYLDALRAHLAIAVMVRADKG